jgi:Uma2 family endonuclease
MSTTTLAPPARQTIADLMKYDGKAELIGGKVVPRMAVGNAHNQIAGNIYVSLRLFSKRIGDSTAYTDNAAFAVEELPSGRESFSADAAFLNRRVPISDTGPIDGPPTFAVEVHSPDQYGRVAESEMADKREEYFEAGTVAVWDVNPKSETVTLYCADRNPVVFQRGETAHAGPAVPGWSMSVDEVFDD